MKFRDGIEPKMQVHIEEAGRGSPKALKRELGLIVFKIACSLEERLKPYGIVDLLDEYVVEFFAYFCQSNNTSLQTAWNEFSQR